MQVLPVFTLPRLLPLFAEEIANASYISELRQLGRFNNKVLDNIRSCNNIGSVFRTSDALLIEKIYLCGITATPPSNEIRKTALDAEKSMNWEYLEHTEEAVKKLKDEGYKVYAIEQVENSLDEAYSDLRELIAHFRTPINKQGLIPASTDRAWGA